MKSNFNREKWPILECQESIQPHCFQNIFGTYVCFWPKQLSALLQRFWNLLRISPYLPAKTIYNLDPTEAAPGATKEAMVKQPVQAPDEGQHQTKRNTNTRPKWVEETDGSSVCAFHLLRFVTRPNLVLSPVGLEATGAARLCTEQRLAGDI